MKLPGKIKDRVTRIIKAKIYKDIELLEYERLKLCQSGLIILVVYDIQCTEAVKTSEDLEKARIMQYSFMNPLSMKYISSYVKSPVPISEEMSRLTSIYNSTEPEFYLLTEIPCDSPHLMDPIRMPHTKHLNRVDIVDQPVKSLEDMNAPYFYQEIPRLVEFLDADSDSDNMVIFLSHQGSQYKNEILTREILASCSHFSGYVFVDSDVLFQALFNNTPISTGSNLLKFESMFGPGRENYYDTVRNVQSLWTDIEYVIKTAYNRSDYCFILSKILETLV